MARCNECNEKFQQKSFRQKFCRVHQDCITAEQVWMNQEYAKNRREKPAKIKQVSKKRNGENIIYSKKSKEFKLANPVCQICNTNKTTDVHHTNGRNGSRLTDSNFWMALCRLCHGKVHLDPIKSRENGWLI